MLALLLLCASCLSVYVSAETYIVPTDDAPCPEEETHHCMTLSELVSSGTLSTTELTNVTVQLLPGNHILSNNLTVGNVLSLSIIGNGTSEHGTKVMCNPDVHFTFCNIDMIFISGVFFSGCFSSITKVNNFLLDNCLLQGKHDLGSRLELVNVSSSTIHSSNFVMNRQLKNAVLGGTIFIDNSSLSIYGCLFDSNHANYAGSSLYALSSSVVISNNTFLNNTSVFHGGAIEIDQESELFIDNCIFSGNSIEQSEREGIRLIGGGAICALKSSNITVSNSCFVDNSANANTTAGGAIYAAIESNVVVSNSEFIGNYAGHSGGAIGLTDNCTAHIFNSKFVNTTSAALITSRDIDQQGGGAIASLACTIVVDNCEFMNNSALEHGRGAAIGYVFSLATIRNSVFVNNVAVLGGGAIGSANFSVCTISNCTFINNSAATTDGGAINCENSKLTLEGSTFDSNYVFSQNMVSSGGALDIGCDPQSVTVDPDFLCSGTITNCSFTRNDASTSGAAISLRRTVVLLNGTTSFFQNGFQALNVFHVDNSIVKFDGNVIFQDNIGSIFVYSSNVTFLGQLTVAGVSKPSNSRIGVEQGGALSCFASYIDFNGKSTFYNNTASLGGGFLALQCSIYVKKDTELNIVNNLATISGGGIYSFQSDLFFEGQINISENSAMENGGGINAVVTDIIYSSGTLSLIKNSANESGGGMYIESRSKLYVIKYIFELESESLNSEGLNRLNLQFIGNSANFGGAICVDDTAIPFTCKGKQTGESAIITDCFFQTLAFYSTFNLQTEDVDRLFNELNLKNTNFTDNFAREDGHSIYGGLLDRCGVSIVAEVNVPFLIQEPRIVDAIEYLYSTTNIDEQDISSLPVRVCFCLNNIPDCDYELPTVTVRKGESFSVSLVAVDQVNHTIPSNISSIASQPAAIQKGQEIQPAYNQCQDLIYNVIAPVDVNSADISVFAVGPCQDYGISRSTIDVIFLSCPIGFIESVEGCDCDPVLVDNGFIQENNCSVDSQSVRRQDDAWINFNESTKEYIASKKCPLDYCVSSRSEVFVDLNVSNGADVQCANNRSGILCGRCADGLSLLLGTTHCGECSNHNGLALLILFAIAGILLIIFILICNLTTAVGTINGLIFYANIMSVNRASFLPRNIHDYVFTVFLAWINLDFGYETCFYSGMDEYAKTWLQLAFPTYIILLVVAIIIISRYSIRFSKLIANKNPVATLATLILLSYTRILRLFINGASFSTIYHYDRENTSEPVNSDLVWRHDGNLAYFDVKRIPLLIIVFLITLVGIFFALLLLFWQCFQRFPNKHPFKIIYNPVLKSFMDAFHAPFKDRHRYWIGVQLLVRIILYVVLAVNDNDSARNSLSVSIVTCSLLMFASLINGGIYKIWLFNILENSYLFNLLLLSISKVYIDGLSSKTDKVSLWLTYVSISIALVTFIGTLIYHTCAFVLPHEVKHLEEKIRRKTAKKFNLRNLSDKNQNALQKRPRSDAIALTTNFVNLRGPIRDLLEIAPEITEESDQLQASSSLPEPQPSPQNEKRVQIVTHTSISRTPYIEREIFTT